MIAFFVILFRPLSAVDLTANRDLQPDIVMAE